MSFKDLIESSFYDTPEEKANFLGASENKFFIDSFYCSFIGMVALRKAYPGANRVVQYLKRDLKLRASSITDDNNDMSLIVKLASDKGYIDKSLTNKITRFLVVMKQGKDVNEAMFREQIFDILIKKSGIKLRPSPYIMPFLKGFRTGEKTLSELVRPLYDWAKKKGLSQEFVKLARPLVIAQSLDSKAVQAAASAPPIPVSTPTTPAVSTPAMPVQKSPVPVKRGITQWDSLNKELMAIDPISPTNADYMAITFALFDAMQNGFNRILGQFGLNKSNWVKWIKDMWTVGHLRTYFNRTSDASFNPLTDNFYNHFLSWAKLPKYALKEFLTLISLPELSSRNIYNVRYWNFLINLGNQVGGDITAGRKVFRFLDSDEGKALARVFDINKFMKFCVDNRSGFPSEMAMQDQLVNYFGWDFISKSNITDDTIVMIHNMQNDLGNSQKLFHKIKGSKYSAGWSMDETWRSRMLKLGLLQSYVDITVADTGTMNQEIFQTFLAAVWDWGNYNSSAVDETKKMLGTDDVKSIYDDYPDAIQWTKNYLIRKPQALTGILKWFSFEKRDFQFVEPDDFKFWDKILDDSNVFGRDLTKTFIYYYSNDLSDAEKRFGDKWFKHYDKYIRPVVKNFKKRDDEDYLLSIGYQDISKRALTGKIVLNYLDGLSAQKVYDQCFEIFKLAYGDSKMGLLLFLLKEVGSFDKKSADDILLKPILENIMGGSSYDRWDRHKKAYFAYVSKFNSDPPEWFLKDWVVSGEKVQSLMYEATLPEYKDIDFAALPTVADQLQKVDPMTWSEYQVERIIDKYEAAQADAEDGGRSEYNKSLEPFVDKILDGMVSKLWEQDAESQNMKKAFGGINFFEAVKGSKKYHKLIMDKDPKAGAVIEKHLQQYLKEASSMGRYHQFAIDMVKDNPTEKTLMAFAKGTDNSRVINYIDDYQQLVSQMYLDGDRKNLENFLATIAKGDEKAARRIANKVRQGIVIGPIVDTIMGDDVPIKPAMKLDAIGIRNLLKFNNFEFASKRTVKRKDEQWTGFLDRSQALAKDMNVVVPKLKATYIETTQDEIDKKTVQYHNKYHAGVHGDIALEIVDEFNVDLAHPEFYEFKKLHPSNIINPAFHGTGTVAASMILRFGFTVADVGAANKAGVKTAGRALGRGIYFGVTLDKVAGYIGDKSWSHRYGSLGYVFEMEALLGIKDRDSKEAGTGSSRSQYSFRSPEYCVFDPGRQLRIVKAYKVKQSSINYVKSLEKDLKSRGIDTSPEIEDEVQPTKESVNRYEDIFRALLTEQTEVKTVTDQVRYVFMNGLIATGNELEMKYFDDVLIRDEKHVDIQPSQSGPVVVINNDLGLNGTFYVPNTREWIDDDPQGLFSQYKILIYKKLK